MGFEPTIRHTRKTLALLSDSCREAELWIYENQLARRNLHPRHYAYYRGKLFDQQKKPVGRPEKLAQNEPIKGQTAKRLAKEHDVSTTTIKRDAAFARGVDIVEEAMPGAKRAILSESLPRLARFGGTLSAWRWIRAPVRPLRISPRVRAVCGPARRRAMAALARQARTRGWICAAYSWPVTSGNRSIAARSTSIEKCVYSREIAGLSCPTIAIATASLTPAAFNIVVAVCLKL